MIKGKIWILGLGAMMTFAACGTSKKTAKVPPLPTSEPVKPNEYASLYSNQFLYKTFNGKAQMHYKGNDQDQNFTANLRMEKDKKIWFSAIAMGVAEVARANITPDRLQAIVRLSRDYYDMSFEEGLQKLNAPVQFDMLENLLIGNPVMMGLPIKKIDAESSLVKIITEKDGYVQTLTYNKADRTLSEQIIESEEKKFKCLVKYSKYVSIGGQPFATYREITIDDLAKNKNTLLEMDFSRYDLDGPLDTTFNIPSGYTKKSL